MTTVKDDAAVEFKALTLDIEKKVLEDKSFSLDKDGSSTIEPEIFTKTLEVSDLSEETVKKVFNHVLHFGAAVGKVAVDQALGHIKSNPNYSAEVQVPLQNGHRITYFIEGTKEVSDGNGGRQTIHGHINNKLELRGWKAADFGKVRQSFREQATALLNK